jgi:hypothetical protein
MPAASNSRWHRWRKNSNLTAGTAIDRVTVPATIARAMAVVAAIARAVIVVPISSYLRITPPRQ